MSESESNTGKIQTTDTGKISEIASLLRSESPPDEPELQDAGAPDEPPPEAEQAESADAEPETPSIDYELVIPISASDGEGEGGESQTISQLKDHYQATKSFESERDTWDETRRVQENEQMVARQQLNSLAVMLGDVKPELLKAAQEHLALNSEHEARMLLQVYPDWSEPAVKKTASAAMLETARQYGFSEQEFLAIDNHKVIKLLNDFTVMLNKAKAGRKKLEEAAATTKAQKPAAPSIKPGKRESVVERARTGSEPDKIRAIAGLIEAAESDGKPSR